MSIFSQVYIRRGEIIRPIPKSRLRHLIRLGNIFASDQISTNKKNWVRFDRDAEFADYFKPSRSPNQEQQSRSVALPSEREFLGVLVCPQCKQDYPDLADYKSLVNDQDILDHIRPKRFKQFLCTQCGAILKKTLGPWTLYLKVGIVFFSFTIFAYIFNMYFDHDPVGLGFDLYYENQYLDGLTMFFIMFMSAITYLIPTAVMEKYCQRLEYGKNPVRVFHQCVATIIGVVAFTVLSLGLYLNICKDLITFQVKPTFHHNTEKILKWTPLWQSPYFTVQGQGYLLNGEFSKAVENFDRSIELKKDHSYPYFYRGIAHYYLDIYDLAELDMNKAIEIDTGKWELNDLYKKLWIFLAREKRDGSGKAYLKSIRSELKKNQWPDSLLLFFAGEIDVDRLEIIPKKMDRTKRCQVHFYTGIFFKMEKRYEEARTAFEDAQDSKAEDCIEIHTASFELASLADSN
jgi:hypothetical protein